MKALNQSQKEFVETSGNLILIAGPGTGKTHALIFKLQALLEKGVPSSDILALTFTHKAALEMNSRLEVLSKPLITTFHGLCYLNLNEAQKKNLITDELQKELLVKKVLKKTNLKLNIKEASLLISLYKIGQVNNINAFKLADSYNQILKQKNLIDYDDLLLDFKPSKKYKYVFVDEFQDTNKLQYQIIKKLVLKNSQVQVVGDPYQNIYTFRGATPNLFDVFKKDFKAKRLELTATYRSVKRITKFTNSFYKDRNLETQINSFGKIELVQTPSKYSEANYIIEKIKSAIGGLDLNSASEVQSGGELDFASFAVIFRSHWLGKIVEKKLMQNNIPFQKAGASSIWASKAGEMFIREAKQNIKNKVDPVSFLNTLSLGEKENLSLKPHLYRFETMEQFLEEYETLKQNDFIDQQASAVSLLTMHASKGLEFDTVFIIGLDDANMPMTIKKDKMNKNRLEEEKRLLYVGCSRAKRKLILLYTSSVSRFFSELDLDLVNTIRDEKAYKRKLKKAQIKLF